ncbi:SusD/RagB family nutrient-binding outer membrane lipoprotein [Flavobacterium sp. LB2P84]|uniref:SusD/RagB family nutrient-binding outer membrane lipoprotein n=1 Tax=Flavobacterium yafengii TaxID=3041253 RepID=UPI0024A8BDDE|nr:SusD/RagB family nutrient-binding outer membrane lipoprotein [Flavobacterium yafengii]MDI6034523.1 SusD/RagB family nutrient-binding outer membrane lipoprotein [Flavobacterium yafengii]
MKKRIISALSVIVILVTASCSTDLEEINIDPNRPEAVPTYGIFNYANKAIMDGTRGPFSSARIALPWVQYSAQRNYTEEDRFQFRQESNTALFNSYYLAANNYKSIIDLNVDPATKDEMSAYGNNDNQIAAARIMLAYTFSQLVDTYGDVPYYSYGNSDPDFQALQLDEGILKAKYARQEKIYTDLLKELKEASEMIVLTEVVFTKGDQLFQGNAEKLKRFSNSLRLRIANRVKGIIPGAEDHIANAITSGVMLSNADNIGLTYENNTVNPSPLYIAFFIDNRNDFTISNTFVDLLKGNLGNNSADPRLQKYAAPITATLPNVGSANYTETEDLSQYIGMPYGIPSALAPSQLPNTSLFSSNILKTDYTEYFMEYAEVEFLLAENNNWNQINYIKGITASMDRWGVTSTKIAEYLLTLPVASKENVLTQKYIALYMQPTEAWSEYRRTGFPNTILKPGDSYNLNIPFDGEATYIFQALNNLTEMPTRLNYPVNSAQLNGENYQEASSNIGGDLLTTKLIWDRN